MFELPSLYTLCAYIATVNSIHMHMVVSLHFCSAYVWRELSLFCGVSYNSQYQLLKRIIIDKLNHKFTSKLRSTCTNGRVLLVLTLYFCVSASFLCNEREGITYVPLITSVKIIILFLSLCLYQPWPLIAWCGHVLEISSTGRYSDHRTVGLQVAWNPQCCIGRVYQQYWPSPCILCHYSHTWCFVHVCMSVPNLSTMQGPLKWENGGKQNKWDETSG